MYHISLNDLSITLNNLAAKESGYLILKCFRRLSLQSFAQKQRFYKLLCRELVQILLVFTNSNINERQTKLIPNGKDYAAF